MDAATKGILFDLGDTLVRYAHLPVNRLFFQGGLRGYRYLQSLGKPVPVRWLYLLRQLVAIRWAHLKGRITGREFNALELLDHQSRRMGHPLTPAESAELAWQFYSPLKESAPFFPEVEGVLRGLRDRGLKLGIVSNSFLPGEVLDRHLAEGRLLELLPVRVYSCEVDIRKPDGGIFQVALDRCNLSAREVVFVGDTPREDILGAKRLGMRTVLRRRAGVKLPDDCRPDHVIDDLSQLEDVLETPDSGLAP
jgi:putative hydrolase of the HAD superfamily